MISWISDGVLAVGHSLTFFDDVSPLIQSGIKAVINLEEDLNYADKDLMGMELYHFPVPDFSVPSPEMVERFLVTVQHHFERGETVYVHCTAGCGRTGTMVGIWLATLQLTASFEELVADLREKRPCAIETDKQMKLVKEYFERFSS